jgi:hypothetical protein
MRYFEINASEMETLAKLEDIRLEMKKRIVNLKKNYPLLQHIRVMLKDVIFF